MGFHASVGGRSASLAPLHPMAGTLLVLLLWQGIWRPPLSFFPWANGALWEGEPLGTQRKGDFQRERFQELLGAMIFPLKCIIGITSVSIWALSGPCVSNLHEFCISIKESCLRCLHKGKCFYFTRRILVRSRNSVTVSARVTEQEGGMLCPQRCQCGVQGVLWRRWQRECPWGAWSREGWGDRTRAT